MPFESCNKRLPEKRSLGARLWLVSVYVHTIHKLNPITPRVLLFSSSKVQFDARKETPTPQSTLRWMV